MSFFVEDPVLEVPRGPHPWGRRFQGRDEVRGAGQPVRRPPRRPLRRGPALDQRRPGCSEWLVTGTTVQGERVEVRGCDLFEFEGDKIARKDSYWKLVDR
jgi:ketosteroid isomerase-like protein